MFDNINFDEDKPVYVNDLTIWYHSKYSNDYLTEKQAFNLLPLDNLCCFVVQGDGYTDLVLIDDKQNLLRYYPYTLNGYEQMIAYINMLKIDKYFEYDRV